MSSLLPISSSSASPAQQGLTLVTGASGFVGSHLVRFLSGRGKQIRALYRSVPPAEERLRLPGVEWMQCDLLDLFAVEDMLKGVSDIYHCAAVVSFHPDKAAELMQVNVAGTANLVNEALIQGIRKMVFLSSVAALGRNAHTREISEEEQWEESRHNSSYGQSKYLAEMEVWRGIGEGLDAAIVNPGIILGEGNWKKGSARLMKVAFEEFPFYTEGITAWVDVQDVVRVMHLLMESKVSAERFILSEGNRSYREIFTMMARALEKRPPHIKAGPLLTGMIWRWNALLHRLTGREIAITRETAASAQRICHYKNDKIKRFFPSFSYTPVQDTICRMAESFQFQADAKA